MDIIGKITSVSIFVRLDLDEGNSLKRAIRWKFGTVGRFCDQYKISQYQMSRYFKGAQMTMETYLQLRKMLAGWSGWENHTKPEGARDFFC